MLWGVTGEQLEKLGAGFDQTGTIPTHLTVTSPMSGIVIQKDLTQGQYCKPVTPPYTVADLGTLWLKAEAVRAGYPRS